MTIDPARYDGHTFQRMDLAFLEEQAAALEATKLRAKTPHEHYMIDAAALMVRAFMRHLLKCYSELDRLQAENERLTAKLADLGGLHMDTMTELQSAYDSLDALEIEITRLRSLIPVWVTVTDDPATLPPVGVQVRAESTCGRRFLYIRYGKPAPSIHPGDRWCYVPTPDPKVANSRPLTPDQTTQHGETK